MVEIDPIVAFVFILVVAFTIPEAIRRLKITYVPFYIIAGIILGPVVMNFQSMDAFDFIADIGLFMLVFIAGLEIHETGMKNLNKSVKYSIFSSIACFLGGFILGELLGYPLPTSLLLGTIMMSSSVGEIIPMVQSSTFLREQFGHFIFPAIIIMDATSLFALAFIIQIGEGLRTYILFTIGSLMLILLILYGIPELAHRFFSLLRRKPEETDLRFVLTILLAMVAIGELIHLHGIVISFLVGIVMGEYIDEKTFSKLYGFGHGFFIPIFFIVLGMNLDIGVLTEAESILITLSVVGTLIICKVIGSVAFAKTEGISTRNGIILGITVWPQLSATIAAATIGVDLAIFDQQILVAIVIMSIFTAIITPFVLRFLISDEETKHTLNNHTIVIGYGRNSSLITHLLRIQEKDLIVIDNNMGVIEELKESGTEVVFGDGSDRGVLIKAGIEDAETVIVTIPDEHEEYLCLMRIKEINPNCYTIAVVHTIEQSTRIREGRLSNYVIWPEELSSVEIVDHLNSVAIKREKEKRR
ncbi:MAG: cation:proton antiporter [Halobacteriota archaeon]|nr:cation:proton antiporter [Halobacteriota archaeon]